LQFPSPGERAVVLIGPPLERARDRGRRPGDAIIEGKTRAVCSNETERFTKGVDVDAVVTAKAMAS
jgi:hypothetical protein